MSAHITRIQDNGNKFILEGSSNLYSKLKGAFDSLPLGITVTRDEDKVHVLYTENNRDIVLRMLDERTEK